MGRNVLLLYTSDRERYECPFCLLALDDPLQLECGDRVCASCAAAILFSNTEDTMINPFKCLICGLSVRYEMCFMDKACSRELNNIQVKCKWLGCKWMGFYRDSLKHEEICKWVIKTCEHCKKEIPKKEVGAHLDPENYGDGCNRLQRPCIHKQNGCKFKGNTYQLNQHECSSRDYHFYLTNIKPRKESAMLQDSMFRMIHECKYQLLTPLNNIDSSLKDYQKSQDMVFSELSEIKQLMINNASDVQVTTKILALERTIEKSHKNELLRQIQCKQNELKRLLCGSNQFAHVYDAMKPLCSLIYEFKIPSLAHHVAEAKNGQSYFTEQIIIGDRKSRIAFTVYLNGKSSEATWGKYISVYVMVKQSTKWPFRFPLTVCLLIDHEIHKWHQLTPDDKNNLSNSRNIVFGIPKFASTSTLNIAHVVNNNCLNLLCLM